MRTMDILQPSSQVGHRRRRLLREHAVRRAHDQRIAPPTYG
jgi:hypothetical protein